MCRACSESVARCVLGVAAHHDHGQLGSLAPDLLEHPLASDVGHGEVEHDAVEALRGALEGRESRVAAARGRHLEARVLQEQLRKA